MDNHDLIIHSQCQIHHRRNYLTQTNWHSSHVFDVPVTSGSPAKKIFVQTFSEIVIFWVCTHKKAESD
jgi:hypothetical protein